MKDLKDILSHFFLAGKILEIKPLGAGLINDSYKVTTVAPDTPDYVLQRINHSIFKDVDMLQNNFYQVTTHIRHKLETKGETDIDRKVLTLIPTTDGKLYYFDGESYWRVLIFIPNAKSYEAVTPEFSYYAGQAFGNFQAMLSDIPVELGETIPDFHNMEFRLKQLQEAITADPVGRVASVKPIIDELDKRADAMCLAERLHREGKLPKRICHCDTKVNNMMFDENGHVLCVIDLDTVMPSYIFSDFGDFMRTAANTGEEDDKNLDNVNFNMEIFSHRHRNRQSALCCYLVSLYANRTFPDRLYQRRHLLQDKISRTQFSSYKGSIQTSTKCRSRYPQNEGLHQRMFG